MPSICQTWVLASIGIVVEMGILSIYIETTAYGVYYYHCVWSLSKQEIISNQFILKIIIPL
jgi:hypothetical protein